MKLTLAKKAAAWWLRSGGVTDGPTLAELLNVSPAVLAKTPIEAMQIAADAVASGTQKLLVVECRLARPIRCRTCDGASIDIVPCQKCRRHGRKAIYSAPPPRQPASQAESGLREYAMAFGRRRAWLTASGASD